MTVTIDALDPVAAARQWLADLDAALRLGRPDALVGLFAQDGSWRDIVALTWDIRSFGTGTLVHAARAALMALVPGNLALRADWPPTLATRGGRPVIEALFEFRTKAGRGEGVVRLVAEGGTCRAWTLLTALAEIDAVPERVRSRRPSVESFAEHFGNPNWLDRREAELRYGDREPAVLVVGGGQAGLSLAARLRTLGIDTLLVERSARIGDNWRLRYHSLRLHNEVEANHLPHMPFPDTWPTYVPKDQMAGWLETYADAMEINAWTSTQFVQARRDTAGRWAVELRRGDGFLRILHPRHIVMATGVSGTPRLPNLPGLGDFQGRVLHSSEFVDAKGYRGQQAIVFGVGNSGSDIAQDLHASGCAVTMVQRGSITVVSQNPGARVLYAMYQQGYPLDICDLVSVASPSPAAMEGYRVMTQRVRELDRELIAGLNSIGFQTDYGADETGFAVKYFRTGGGHYLNVGCSELLISGAIGLLKYADVDRLVADGVRMRGGDIRRASLLVLATGYESLSADVAEHFGNDVADEVGPVWGLDDEGELRNVWRPTPVPGLWFHAGALQHCRVFSKYLALQIAATETGLLPGHA